jgi:hypothetical protein
VQLFTVDAVAIKIWGGFFKQGKGHEWLNHFEKEEIASLKEEYMRKPTSKESEVTFVAFVHRFKEHKTDKVRFWQEKYKESKDASDGYFAYVDCDDHERDFKDIFGFDSASGSSDGGHHGNHHDGFGGHSDGGSHSSCSSNSSCSSCSSCSSS